MFARHASAVRCRVVPLWLLVVDIHGLCKAVPSRVVGRPMRTRSAQWRMASVRVERGGSGGATTTDAKTDGAGLPGRARRASVGRAAGDDGTVQNRRRHLRHARNPGLRCILRTTCCFMQGFVCFAFLSDIPPSVALCLPRSRSGPSVCWAYPRSFNTFPLRRLLISPLLSLVHVLFRLYIVPCSLFLSPQSPPPQSASSPKISHLPTCTTAAPSSCSQRSV